MQQPFTEEDATLTLAWLMAYVDGASEKEAAFINEVIPKIEGIEKPAKAAFHAKWNALIEHGKANKLDDLALFVLKRCDENKKRRAFAWAFLVSTLNQDASPSGRAESDFILRIAYRANLATNEIRDEAKHLHNRILEEGLGKYFLGI